MKKDDFLNSNPERKLKIAKPTLVKRINVAFDADIHAEMRKYAFDREVSLMSVIRSVIEKGWKQVKKDNKH